MSVAAVVPGSVTDQSGVKAGDFVVKLNGHDVLHSSMETVQSILKFSLGSPLTLHIARPSPVPVTEVQRRRAIIVLQTKVGPLGMGGGGQTRDTHCLLSHPQLDSGSPVKDGEQ